MCGSHEGQEGKYDEALCTLERIVRLRPQKSIRYYYVPACTRKGRSEGGEYLKGTGKDARLGLIARTDLDPIRKTEPSGDHGEIRKVGRASAERSRQGPFNRIARLSRFR